MKKIPIKEITLGSLIFLLLSSFRKSSKKDFAGITLIDGELKLRGCDNLGCGHFGASRDSGTRIHKGLDIACTPFNDVYSPVTGTVYGFIDPYGDGQYNGISILSNIDGLTYIWKIMYCKPLIGLSINHTINKGQLIGACQDISKRYAGITPHLHIELLKNGDYVDPDVFI